jgi:antitoxin PrlF
MSVATVSSKGQITLPADARRALGISTGDRVSVRVQDGVIVVTPVADFLSLQGMLGRALSAAEEEAAMRDEAAGAE